MKSFFKYVLATVTGIFVSFFLLLLIFIVIITAIVNTATTDSSAQVANNSVLVMQLNHGITERTIPNPFEELDIPGFPTQRTLGLDDILHRIKSAKTDGRIKGIYLDLSVIPASFSTLKEIRDELLDFKESGKFVIAYSEAYSQKAYYIASLADKVFVNPQGALDFRGLDSRIMFLKGTLDKLDIDMQIIKVGTYKSAVEPFILDKMSPENREQVSSYLQSIYTQFLSEIAESRSMTPDSLHMIADQMLVRNADDAVTYRLADSTLYKDELLAELKNRLELDEKDDVKSISLLNYAPTSVNKVNLQNRVAILYANGEILGGEGSDSQIGSDKISRELRKLRRDDKIKAVVFRINSPGGSALASDVIWREVELLSQVKPVVVSMGDVAASGGYYIAAAADSIIAQPNTITGSIGVFGTVPNLQRFWNNKLGITFDGVKTGKYADMLNGTFERPMTAEEAQMMQLEVNRIYDTFIQRVAEGRQMTAGAVDSIGQGRVWSGTQALQLGLVDKLGGIDDAIATAARMADLEDDYQLVRYPTIKPPFELFFGTTTDRIQQWFVQKSLGAHYPLLEQVQSVVNQSGIQARMPYTLEIF